MTSTTATVAVGAAIDTISDASGDSTKDVSSRFAAFSVDEPSQAFLDIFRNAPHERPKPGNEDYVSYEVEP